jgi:urea transport system substrate-binding protein
MDRTHEPLAATLGSDLSRRDFLARAGLLGAGLSSTGALLAACAPGGGGTTSSGKIKVGAIIPFTGIETHNGLSMKYGLEIGADEINKAGGLGGSQVQLIQEDDGGDVDKGVQAANKLIQQDQVDLINGTLTSSVRAAVFQVTKQHQTLFMNPTFYEGLLCDKSYFSSGAAPNQTIEPLAAFALKNLGKSFYFVGSDYIWGRGSIAAAKPAVTSGGGTVAGEEYAPFGTSDFTAIIDRIRRASPDVVWPFVAGQDGITFLKQLSDFGVRSKVKICADYIDELIVPALSNEVAQGIVNCSTYYVALTSSANQSFLKTMRSKYGANSLISSFGMQMYNNMKLLEQATKKAGKWDKTAVLGELAKATFDGPSGTLTVDAKTQYVTQDAYIATVQSDKSFKLEQTLKQVPPKAGCTVA